VVFVLEEFVLHVAVANSAGDAAQFSEAAEDLLRCGLVRRQGFGRKPLNHREEFELGLDAASGGAEFVDGFGRGSRDSYRHRGLETPGLFRELFDGTCSG
jgi:hypothetical protein